MGPQVTTTPSSAHNHADSQERKPILRVKNTATRHLGKVSIALFAVVFFFAFFWKQILPVVGPGEAGVMFYRFFGGTQIDRVVGEGQKFLFPWDTLYVYNVRIQERTVRFQLLTKEGLSLFLTFSIRFRPEIETLGRLHAEVGPNYVDSIVVPNVQTALLSLFGQLEVQDIQDTHNPARQRAISDAISNLSTSYLHVDDIVFRSVELPDAIVKSIEDKVAQKVLASSYVYRQQVATLEGIRLVTDAEGKRDANKILDESITPNMLRWKGIDATSELAKSANAKTVIIGKADGLPLILNPDK